MLLPHASYLHLKFLQVKRFKPRLLEGRFRSINLWSVIPLALFMLLLAGCSNGNAEIESQKLRSNEPVLSTSTPQPVTPSDSSSGSKPTPSTDSSSGSKPTPSTDSSSGSKPVASSDSSKVAEPTPTVVPSPTPKPNLLKKIVNKITSEPPADNPVPSPEPTKTADPSKKSSIIINPDVPDLTVDSSGSGWNHRSADEINRLLSPPDSDLITLDHNTSTGTAIVSANNGSVPPEAYILIANMELGNIALVKADSEGAFETTIPSHAGTHILVKQDSSITGHSSFRTGNTDAVLNDEQISPPGIILRVPVPPSTVGGYSVAGGARMTSDGPPWLFTGNLSDITLKSNGKFNVTGQIKVLTDIQSLSEVNFNFAGQMLSDEVGYQIGPSGEFLSTILTPTGLPIERNEQKSALDIFEENCQTNNLEWRPENGGQIADISCEVQIDSDAPKGTYVTWLTLNTPSEVEEIIRPSDKLLKLGSALGQDNSIALAAINIDSAEPLRFTTTLLADLLQEGTRGGILAREDADRLAIGSRIVTHHNPIIPRLDPYGNPLRHRLDPYLPLMGITDRSPPAIPLIGFDFSNSELEITVERPDGKTDLLGPAPLIAYGVKSPTTPNGDQIAGGGGHIGEIPQLLADKDVFKYEFPVDGDYVVNLAGYIADNNGQLFTLSGTYDLMVANSLDIETLLLPGTPFEVGDSLPVGLQVYPNIPADIKLSVTHIGADNTVTRKEYIGTANSSGWWDGEGQSFSFVDAGEYLVEVEARYPDTEDRLWGGRMNYGGVVATPDGPIIAHGLRGIDAIDSIPPPWGFGVDFPADGHLQFPFFTGDVLWGMEGPENRGDLTGLDHFHSSGPGDSVNVGLSMQVIDEDHPLVERALIQAKGRMSGDYYLELLNAGQVPLITTVEEDKRIDYNRIGNRGIRPEDLSVFAYTYASAQRPGVRVREMIQGNGAESAYWRFGDAYHMQSGNGLDGDQPGDFKFMYGGAVIRDIQAKEGVFAIYGSGWVLTDDDDPMGSRFMPPFQGNAGGPNGGPLFTLHGSEIDIFFVPLGVRPGSILETGDIFRMAGPIMPTLPSRIDYTITAPDGSKRSFDGRGNAVGYFYDPEDDFELDAPGLWTVDLAVTHDGMTSAGPVQEPHPQGGPLTPDGSTFTFVVKDNDTIPLNLSTDLTRLSPTDWYRGKTLASFESQLPRGWTGTKGHVNVTIPGVVLADKDIPIENGLIKWNLDAEQMNQMVQNFDSEVLSDTMTVTYHAEDPSGLNAAGTIVTHGTRVPRYLGTELDKPANLEGLATDQTDCVEAETELFESNFEKGSSGWEFSDDRAWSVVQDDGEKVLQGEGHEHAYAGDNWSQTVWRLKVKLIEGNAHLNFQSQGPNRYLVSFREDGTNVQRTDHSSNSNMGKSSVRHNPGEWHVVEIGLKKDLFFVAVNGYLEITQTEPSPLPPGQIWLEVLDNSTVLFDEMRVCALDN